VRVPYDKKIIRMLNAQAGGLGRTLPDAIRPRNGVQADNPSRDIAAQCPVRQRSAQTNWRKLDRASRTPEIIEGVEFKESIKQLQNAA